MSDKDLDLNKILNESFSRLDKVAGNVRSGNIGDDKDNTEKKDLSGIRLGGSEEIPSAKTEPVDHPLPPVDNVGENAEDTEETVEKTSDHEESEVYENKPVSDYAEVAEDTEYSEYNEDAEDAAEEAADERGYVDNGEYHDDLSDEDDDYIEDYKDVPGKRKLEFNVRQEEPHRKNKKKKRKVKPNNSIFTGSLVAVIVIAVSFILSFMSIQFGVEYIGLTRSDESITFDIPEGTNSGTIADLLYQKGIIDNPTLFKLVMKVSGRTNVVPGSITLSPNMTYPSIISEIGRSRKVYETVTITFTEGTSLYNAARLLEEEGVCSASDFLEAFNSDSGFDFEKELTLSNQTLYKMEGFMFPDTYEFYLEDDAENVASKIKQNFQDKMTPEIMQLVDKSGMSLYEVITLASIVQAEADTEENMKLVASVFLNRLSNREQFPNLQSDVTYFYVTNTIAAALGNNSVANYEYLYSTYSCYGLPVGPIGNPGMTAILAVLEPEETSFCYFVTDSVTGEFYYAATYEEHQENIKKAGY